MSETTVAISSGLPKGTAYPLLTRPHGWYVNSVLTGVYYYRTTRGTIRYEDGTTPTVLGVTENPQVFHLDRTLEINIKVKL